MRHDPRRGHGQQHVDWRSIHRRNHGHGHCLIGGRFMIRSRPRSRQVPGAGGYPGRGWKPRSVNAADFANHLGPRVVGGYDELNVTITLPPVAFSNQEAVDHSKNGVRQHAAVTPKRGLINTSLSFALTGPFSQPGVGVRRRSGALQGFVSVGGRWWRCQIDGTGSTLLVGGVLTGIGGIWRELRVGFTRLNRRRNHPVMT